MLSSCGILGVLGLELNDAPLGSVLMMIMMMMMMMFRHPEEAARQKQRVNSEAKAAEEKARGEKIIYRKHWICAKLC